MDGGEWHQDNTDGHTVSDCCCSAFRLSSAHNPEPWGGEYPGTDSDTHTHTHTHTPAALCGLTLHLQMICSVLLQLVLMTQNKKNRTQRSESSGDKQHLYSALKHEAGIVLYFSDYQQILSRGQNKQSLWVCLFQLKTFIFKTTGNSL